MYVRWDKHRIFYHQFPIIDILPNNPRCIGPIYDSYVVSRMVIVSLEPRDCKWPTLVRILLHSSVIWVKLFDSWREQNTIECEHTVYPKKYAHDFIVLYFVVVMQSFIMNSHEVFIHIHQGCFAGTGAIVRLPQCQWSKPDGYGKISQCITTTKHSKAKTVCIFLGIYCTDICVL